MLPSSEALEALIARAKTCERALGKLGSSQNIPAATKAEALSIAREWLRLSPQLISVGVCTASQLSPHDEAMQDVVTKANEASRASALRKDLRTFADGAPAAVVVPLIRHAGSPRQVLARHVAGTFAGLSPEETAYIEEATRCVTVEAYRAAIIMLWAAAVARIHNAIENKGFAAFNTALTVTQSKKTHPFSIVKGDLTVKSAQDLQRIADGPILVIGMELFGYDLQVYQELARLLGQRNDSAHPGMAVPKALDVEQYAAKLEQYVFQRL